MGSHGGSDAVVGRGHAAGRPDTWVTDSARAPRDPAAAQSMSMSMSKRLALAPSTHRSPRERLVLRRDGEPCRCRTRRVPASPDKITLGIDGCKLPGKEISRGEMGARITPVARSCGPTLAAARLVAPLMDCGYSVLSYGAPLLIVDHILL
jgi:hypothetical protein